MKKIFNFRPIFLAFVGLFVGAFFSVNILFSSVFIKVFLCICILVFLALSFLNITFFKMRKVAIWVLIVSLLVGFGYSALKISSYNKNQIDKNISVVGVVSDKIVQENGYSKILLKNVYSPQDNISGKMQLTVYGDISQTIDAGDELYFFTNVKSYPILNRESVVNAKIESSDCKYFAGVNLEKISIKKGDPTFFENIRIKSRTAILSNTSNEEIGNLIYSVIFGDKTFISNDVYSAFSKSGAAHLLAVSGLHVGFLVALVLFVLKLFKCGRISKFIITALFLLAYNVLCGFCASIVRASVMTVILLLSYLFGERNDAITSLGLAGILILIAKPLMAFDVGFQLSFASVFGIICLSKPLSKFFCKKCKFPKPLAEGFSVSLAANIGTLPFVGLSFKFFAYIGLISNLILIPVFGIVFCISFLVFVLGAIIPALNCLFSISEIGFAIIYKMCQVFALCSTIKIVKIGLAFLIVFPAIMLVSDYSLIRKNAKKSIVCILVAVCFSVFGVGYVPTKVAYASVSKLEECATVITSKRGEVLLISENFEDFEIYDAENYLVENNFEKYLSTVLITGEANEMTKVYDFAKHNPKVNVLITSNCFLDVFEINKYDNLQIINRIEQIGAFCFVPFEYNNNICAIQIDFDDASVMILNDLDYNEVNFLNTAEVEVDVLVCNKFKACFNNLEIKYKTFIASSSSDSVNKKVFITNKNENFTVKKIEGVVE